MSQQLPLNASGRADDASRTLRAAHIVNKRLGSAPLSGHGSWRKLFGRSHRSAKRRDGPRHIDNTDHREACPEPRTITRPPRFHRECNRPCGHIAHAHAYSCEAGHMSFGDRVHLRTPSLTAKVTCNRQRCPATMACLVTCPD
jgi:hypothetical protein